MKSEKPLQNSYCTHAAVISQIKLNIGISLQAIHGFGVREIGRLVYDAMEKYFDSSSFFSKFLYRRIVYSKMMKQRMRSMAITSQERIYPNDLVFEFVEGAKGEFDYGIDFTECAICKFYTEHNAEKFLPYLCLADFAIYHSYGVGMKRTQTLGSGRIHCDFMYVKGYKTPRGWPPEGLIEFQHFSEE